MAGGVVGDATVRDENTVSGINNGYKCRLKNKKMMPLLMVLHTIKGNILKLYTMPWIDPLEKNS